MSATIPAKLGKYEIRGTLGKGAMGTVYDGWDPLIDRRVAIKTAHVPHASDADAQDALARFKREAQAAGRLSHPNIVGVFDYGETDEVAYIVMEFVSGRSLKEVLDTGDRLTLAATLRLMDDVLAGLTYSHGRGVVHRDIKPANVMITVDDQAKIADFGIARIESSNMTQAGTVMGTPAYMSPEQFMGQTVDKRTDIYSSGAMLYQLLTGDRPFEGGLTAIMHKVLNTTPPRPSELSVSAPPALDAVVARAMARRPEDRFEDAASFGAAMHAAVAGQPAAPALTEGDGDATIVAPAERRPVPARAAASVAAAAPAMEPAQPPATAGPSKLPLLVGGGLAVLVAAGAAAFFLLPGTPTAPTTPARPAEPRVTQAAPSQTASTAPATPATPAAPVAPVAPVATVAPIAPPPVAPTAPAQTPDAKPAEPDQRVATAEPARPPAEASLDPSIRLALAALRPLPGAGQLGLRLADRERPLLHKNDLMLFGLTSAGFAGHVRLDYIQHDGTVTHMIPSSAYPDRTYPANARLDFGKPRGSFEGWKAGPPYGTDMVVAIISTAPILPGNRPDDEPIETYLRDLRQASDTLRRLGGSLAVDTIRLDLEP